MGHGAEGRSGPPASAKDVASLQVRVAVLERMFQGAYEGVKSDVRRRLDALVTQTPPPAPPAEGNDGDQSSA